MRLPSKLKKLFLVIFIPLTLICGLVGYGIYTGNQNRPAIPLPTETAIPTAVVTIMYDSEFPLDAQMHTNIYPNGEGHFRSSPAYADNVIDVLPDGTQFTLLGFAEGENGLWYYVQYNDTYGFIHMSIVEVIDG